MGHSVRLATHQDYENLVKRVGLDFFPIAGDPKKLSLFMVETSGARYTPICNDINSPLLFKSTLSVFFRSIPKIFNKRKLLKESMKVVFRRCTHSLQDTCEVIVSSHLFFFVSSSLNILILNKIMDEIIQST